MRDRRIADDTVLPVEREGETRRSFLRLAGFGVASATLAGCSRGPLELVVPRPELDAAGTAGRAYWIATTCGGCEARCGVLARCRDGRPIKLEGNPDHAVSRGGLCAVGQASLLDLYDGQRRNGPALAGEAVSWPDLDRSVRERIDASPGRVRLLTRTITSPSTRAWIDRFVERTNGRHVEWDPRSASALLDAHEACFGRRAVPRMRFEAAKVIVSFDADFLGTWLSPVEFAKGYAAGRRPDDETPTMSRHVQIESRLSLTGCSADERLTVGPWEMRAAVARLCASLPSRSSGEVDVAALAERAPHGEALDALAEELWAARGACLVVSGSDDPGTQVLVAYANELLGSYGKTLDLDAPSLARRGSDAALTRLIEEMQGGGVDVLVVDGLDPVYELPEGSGFAEALQKVGLVVSTSALADQTTAAAHALAPSAHELASWNDAEPVAGRLSLSQPTVPPLRSARTLRATLAAWLGESGDDVTLLREHWRREVFPRVSGARDFSTFFDGVLHDGFVATRAARPPAPARWNASRASDVLATSSGPAAPPDGTLALVLYSKVALPEGRNAHNPWLHEVPDPLTTVTWDNYVCIAPETAAARGLADGDLVAVAADEGGTAIPLPVRLLPGVHPAVAAVALGYGVLGTDRFSRIGPSWLEGRLTLQEGETVGTRAADLLQLTASGLRSSGRAVRLADSGLTHDLAQTQDHHSLEVPHHLAPQRGEVRDVAQSTTLTVLQEDPSHAVHHHELTNDGLWPVDHQTDGPRWGLVVDLSACNGCSGCVVACQAENNVPAVGKDEVRRHREMTWLRVDRYLQGEGDSLRVVHQPMMCQHCANAPCETVCPVLATVHSEDGLNQQVYNRCVGTRYCANNCPYKTRRFNWFDYPRREELRNLALNPDVTVRSRGVMEKCSMCVQRIQEAKAEARREGREVADGEIQTACQQSCPAGAIVFGDLNDPESRAAKLHAGPRAYQALSELNVRPGVTYLAGVRNGPEPETGGRHG